MQNCSAIIVLESVRGRGGLRKLMIIVISMIIVRVRETFMVVVVIPEYWEIRHWCSEHRSIAENFATFYFGKELSSEVLRIDLSILLFCV